MDTARSSDIVFSLAGHDKGREFVVIKLDGDYALIVDGKTRKLTKPKRKNLKHLCLGKMGSTELAGAIGTGKATDSAIRKELAKYRSEAGMTEEGSQFVKR
ncbi:MAG: hypothetical protein EOM51_02175 [Clostridia bacterium]|nr:hypothetical protein [Clostridia bacterium]